MIYLQEILAVNPGSVELFLQAVEKGFLPMAERLGLRAVGVWRNALKIQEVVLFWELDDWKAFAQYMKATETDSALQDWRRSVAASRQVTEAKTLMPAPFVPTKADLLKKNWRNQLYLHETLPVEYGMWDEYQKGLQKYWLPVGDRRGLKLVGFYRTEGTTGLMWEVTAIWAIDGWDKYAEQRITAGTDPGLAEWMTRAPVWRRSGYDRLLRPVPFSPLR